MSQEIEETLAAASDAPAPAQRSALVRFLRAPLELRSYANFVFLALAFPMGLAYFLFLSVGLSLGLGLMVILIGFPLLALVLAGSWGMTALERQLAIHLLGADVPPMGPMQPQSATAPRGFLRGVVDFLANPVTWKGVGYLFLKLPLGIVTFTVTVFLGATTAAFLIAPFVSEGIMEWDGVVWNLDNPLSAALCFLIGLMLAFFSVHVVNGLAWMWRNLASAMLGSRRFATN